MRSVSIHMPSAPSDKPEHLGRRQLRLVIQQTPGSYPIHAFLSRGRCSLRAPTTSKPRPFRISCAGDASVPSITAATEARDDDVGSISAICRPMAMQMACRHSHLSLVKVFCRCCQTRSPRPWSMLHQPRIQLFPVAQADAWYGCLQKCGRRMHCWLLC